MSILVMLTRTFYALFSYVKSGPVKGTLKDMPVIIKKTRSNEPYNAILNTEFDGNTKILRDTGVSIE